MPLGTLLGVPQRVLFECFLALFEPGAWALLYMAAGIAKSSQKVEFVFLCRRVPDIAIIFDFGCDKAMGEQKS